MHGGMGFTWEHDMHFWFKRAKWNEFAFGDATYHRERIDKVNVLISIDETTYDPETGPMGEDHPMVWWHDIGKGRVFYSALGHSPESYREGAMPTMIENAMAWAANL